MAKTSSFRDVVAQMVNDVGQAETARLLTAQYADRLGKRKIYPEEVYRFVTVGRCKKIQRLSDPRRFRLCLHCESDADRKAARDKIANVCKEREFCRLVASGEITITRRIE